MEIFEKTESIYVSFWPFHRKKKNFFQSFRGRKSSVMPESYYEESHLESEYIGREADDIILLKNLPNPKNLRLKSLRTYWENKPWHLIGRNCCYVVIDNLEDVSGSQGGYTKDSYKLVFNAVKSLLERSFLCNE